MQISTTTLNTRLNALFNAGGRTYTMAIAFSDSTESDPETIDFTSASSASVGIASSVFFPVASGKTVTVIIIQDDLSNVIILEDVEDETFSANGTYTVNNVITTLST